MSPLIAGAPPMAMEGRLIAAALGFGLVLALSFRLRGFPSFRRCCLLAAGVLLSLIGFDLLGVPDERGVLAFLVGMSGAVLVGHKALAAEVSRERHRANWLAISAVPIGLSLGLSLFGLWFWQTDPADRTDMGWYAGVFGGIGFFAGVAAAVVVFLLCRSVGPRDRAEPRTAPDRGGS